jgi:tetratricopeptide (TPR) repeat protein
MNNIVHIVHPGIWRDPHQSAETLELARRAVMLDPVDARAQLCLGWSLGMARHHDQATLHMDLAAELNPYDYWTLISAALFHAFCGNFDRARDLAEQSFNMTFTPNPAQWVYQVSILFLSGDYNGALHAAVRAQDATHTVAGWRAATLFLSGQADAAKQEAERFLADIRKRWLGPAAPSAEDIGRWFLHLFPINETEHWERLRDGLVGAGIPVSGISHRDC